MTPQTETSSPKPKAPEYKPQTKLAVVYFRESVTFGGELQSASTPIPLIDGTFQRGSNSVDVITPAWLSADGSVGSPDAARRSDGLVLQAKVHDANTGKRIVRQTFVPWNNVRSVGYRE